MPYFTITDFAAGLDLRRSPLTAPAGTLRRLTNAHVTPGGEIEKRYAFQIFKTLPSNTRGLVSVNQKLYTFSPMSQVDINYLHPTSRLNNHAYAVSDTITVASNPSRVFTCTTAGTTTATEPATYQSATDGVLVGDGSAVFRASTPAGWTTNVTPPKYTVRANAHVYGADSISVASNPARIFTCSKVGTSADVEPPGYASAVDGTVVADGTAAFVASTPTTPDRANSHAYIVDIVTVASSPSRIFTCMTPGTSGPSEPAAYVNTSDNTQLIDGSAVFLATTPNVRGNTHGYTIDTIIVVPTNARPFICTQAGTTAAAEPPEYVAAAEGTEVTDGTAKFRGGRAYTVRANNHAYTVDTIKVPNNKTRIFTCTTAGTSAASQPGPYAGAVDGSIVVDGTAMFLGSAQLYAPRSNKRAYTADTVTVTGNPTRVFTCTTTQGMSAGAEPGAYAGAADGAMITDGTCVFRASTPPSDWIVDAQPAIVPKITEPASQWDVGIMPLECTTLFEIVDYDLFDNKVFVVAWTDAAGNVVRCYDGRSIPKATGYFVKTYKTKMFAVAGSVLSFSAIGNPADWEGTGSGSIDLSLEDSDMTACNALEVYYDKLAILSKTATQLWVIDPDPLKSQYVQTLKDAGTIAWRSVLQYGSGDVMYLSPSGVRSLRARNSSLAAAVSDIGSPLDPVLQDLFRTQGETYVSGCMALLQPVTGRFWIILPDRIYVLSAFPGPKITAWSEYQPTYSSGGNQVGFAISAAVTNQHHVIVRDGNHNVLAYGGVSAAGPVFDDSAVELVFPFHAGDQPATYKTFQALDAAATGQWEVSIALDPDDDSTEDFAGILTGQTFTKGDFPIMGRATHMSLRLRSFVTGPMTLSNLIIHYQLGQARGIGL